MERLDYRDVRFIFGHYVHESLLKIFSGRPIFLFTGVREPVSRAISEYYQMCKIRDRAGLLPLSADEFFAARKNTMCVEYMRAFPTIEKNASGSLADKASEVLGVFDLVYGMDDFVQSSERLFAILGLDTRDMRDANIREIKAENVDFLGEQEAIIREKAETYFDQDIILYERFKSRFGELNLSAGSEGGSKSPSQLRWIPAICARSSGEADFIAHVSRFHVNEFFNLRREDELERQLDRKALALAEMKRFLEERRARS